MEENKEDFRLITEAIVDLNSTAQKLKFSISDLVTFTEEVLNRKIHFLCSALCYSICCMFIFYGQSLAINKPCSKQSNALEWSTNFSVKA